jgi:hypothetical protein
MSMLVIFVRLAQLPVLVTAGSYANEYDVDEENKGHHPGSEYDCESHATSMFTILVRL